MTVSKLMTMTEAQRQLLERGFTMVDFEWEDVPVLMQPARPPHVRRAEDRMLLGARFCKRGEILDQCCGRVRRRGPDTVAFCMIVRTGAETPETTIGEMLCRIIEEVEEPAHA